MAGRETGHPEQLPRGPGPGPRAGAPAGIAVSRIPGQERARETRPQNTQSRLADSSETSSVSSMSKISYSARMPRDPNCRPAPMP